MKRKKIYIVARNSRAGAYGIGTYRGHLMESLKQAGIEFGVIEMDSTVDDVSVTQKDGYEHIAIPAGFSGVSGKAEYHSRNVAYILRELITDDKEYDLIFHINLMNDSVLVSSLKKLFKCKIVLTIHYTNWSFDLLGDTKKLDKIMTTRKPGTKEKHIRADFQDDIKMARKCDQVVYIADHSAETLSKYLKVKKEVVLNYGLEDLYEKLSQPERRSIRTKYLIPEQAKVIVFAGRLDEVKGVKYIIEAFREVLADNADALLVIAGDGEFGSLLKEAEDIWSRIIFTGKIDKNKLYELYRIADVGVMSSLHEEFGFVAAEMLMHGLPTVVSDTGGPAEIVEEGVSGFKIPIVIRDGKRGLDTKLLASRICRLLGDCELSAKMGEGARKRFLDKYELSIFKEKMITVYNSVL